MATLNTERLTLRALAQSDAKELFGARADSVVMEFWDAPPDATWSDTLAVVDLFLSDVRSGTAKYWAIRRRGDESFVGVCDLSEIRSGESADIGFMLVRRHWGVGFGGEVVSCLMEFAKSAGLKLITARIHCGNARSRMLLLRMGFHLVQVISNHEIRPGMFRDCLRFEAML